MTAPVRADQRRYRSPFPFDWRASDFGLLGSVEVGPTGDPDDSDKLRLRARSGQLIEPRGGTAQAIDVDEGSDRTLFSAWPRITSEGWRMASAGGEFARLGWPWTPADMFGDAGFTVLVDMVDEGVNAGSNDQTILVLGEAGNLSPSANAFHVVWDNGGYGNYRAYLTIGSSVATGVSEYTNSDISTGDRVVMLAGVKRTSSGTKVQAFLDIWADGTRLDSTPFESSEATKTIPSAWTDPDKAAIGALYSGSGKVVDASFRRVAWDRGVHQGTAGLTHFGVDL